MKRIGAPLLAAAAALLLLGANAFPAPNSPPIPAHSHTARLSHLLGTTVQDPNAQALGTIIDFVLDSTSAQVEYAIVSSGGVLGLGTRQQALPASTLSIATILQGVLSTSVTRQQWRQYPAFQGDPAALAYPPRPGASPPQPPTPEPNRLQLASKLLGATVLNHQHQRLGTVADLLLDLDQRKPALLIVRNTRFLRRPENFAVPLPLLARGEGDTLLLNASLQRLEQAPLLGEQAQPSATAPDPYTIYRVAGSAQT